MFLDGETVQRVLSGLAFNPILHTPFSFLFTFHPLLVILRLRTGVRLRLSQSPSALVIGRSTATKEGIVPLCEEVNRREALVMLHPIL